MIGVLEITNFKSIKHLRLDCKRLNIFIGQPNTGKSNILESLGLLSFGEYSIFEDNPRKFVRFQSTPNLFYDEEIGSDVEIRYDTNTLNIQFQGGRIQGKYTPEGESRQIDFVGDYDGFQTNSSGGTMLAPFKYYKFGTRSTFSRTESEFLLPPSGDNLLSLLRSNRELRSLANQPFATMGLRLALRPQEGKIEILKEFEDIIVSYPYELASETLQRLIFYLAAIVSNERSVLVFEEPESHAFPYYTKYIAEMIALDENENQYFISTHNPYFLLPILEKSAKEDIAVFITYYENYQTKVKLMSEDDIERVIEIDVFSNIESFLDPQ